MDKIKVDVFNKGVNELPNYATEFSAGFDLKADFSNINNNEELLGNNYHLDLNDKKLILFPGGRVLIPTSLYLAIPDNYELQIRARSGLAIKNGITVLNGIGTLDSDYRGQLCIILINTDLNTPFEIKQGDRIGQGVLNRIEQVEWTNVNSIDELGTTERGQGGFGSTGTK